MVREAGASLDAETTNGAPLARRAAMKEHATSSGAQEQGVPDYVALGKKQLDPRQILQFTSTASIKPGAPAIGQIDLGDVTRDHRFGVEAQPKYFQILFAGSVLGLVEDYEGVEGLAALQG